jgi:signal transduction histidine kinase
VIFKDNGIGFEQAYAQKIFNLFDRLHTRSAYDGTGLGLAICKKIVENHGGTIAAKSRLKEGAEFVVIIPA